MRHILRILLGVLFIYSAFTKGIDVDGTAYKIADYFASWDLGASYYISVTLSSLLVLGELVLGLLLLFRLKEKTVAGATTAILLVLTLFTFYIYQYNSIEDCGCFGDVIKLTNEQTFYKNLIFLGLSILMSKLKIGSTEFFTIWFRKRCFVGMGIVMSLIMIYSSTTLPIKDFRPYKIGTDLIADLTVPEDAKKDKYESFFYYKDKKSGEVKQFDSVNYPWNDTINWEYVSRSEPLLVEKGYSPPLEEFKLLDSNGIDITIDILSENRDINFWILRDISKVEGAIIDRIYSGDESGVDIILTSSGDEEVAQFIAQNGELKIYRCDEVVLKTIIRASRGLVKVNNGKVLYKENLNSIF